MNRTEKSDLLDQLWTMTHFIEGNANTPSYDEYKLLYDKLEFSDKLLFDSFRDMCDELYECIVIDIESSPDNVMYFMMSFCGGVSVWPPKLCTNDIITDMPYTIQNDEAYLSGLLRYGLHAGWEEAIIAPATSTIRITDYLELASLSIGFGSSRQQFRDFIRLINKVLFTVPWIGTVDFNPTTVHIFVSQHHNAAYDDVRQALQSNSVNYSVRSANTASPGAIVTKTPVPNNEPGSNPSPSGAIVTKTPGVNVKQ